MFTGLIEDVGRVLRIIPRGTGMRLTVGTRIPAGDLKTGDSIAVDGCCLTVVEIGKDHFSVDVGQETLARTGAGRLKASLRVNLERAMRMGDRLGGHMVAGHVDGVGKIERIERAPDFVTFHVRAPKEVSRYLIPKGSVAMQGISLTVNTVSDDVFTVGIIPHTLANTNLSDFKEGDEVNLEADMIGKYVEKFFLAARGESPSDPPGAITLDFLAKHGFT